MRDYCKRASLAKTVSFKLNSKWQTLLLWLLIFSLLGAVIWWALQAWRGANQSDQQQRILLYSSTRPVAIVDFWPSQQQVFVVDLAESVNFALQEQATFSASTAYSFGLGMLFDQAFLVENLSTDQESIKNFLSQQSSQLAALIANDQLWWRTESFEKLQNRRQKQKFNCPVAVINATSASGLAANFSLMLERSQFAVIRKANLSADYQQSQVIYDTQNLDCQFLLDRLDRFGKFQINQQDQAVLSEYRAKMVIILGEDLASLHTLFVDFL
jgi:hypothetical protein